MQTLETFLNNIANEFECTVVIGNEFAYYYAQSLIVVNPSDNSVDFLNFSRKLGLNTEVSSFTISFFHELGHNETIDFVKEYKGDKNKLNLIDYFNLEEELEATLWAIDYCNNHMDVVKQIENILK